MTNGEEGLIVGYKRFLTEFCTINGRIRRRDFILYEITNLIVLLLLYAMVPLVIITRPLVLLSAAVRRLHDTGRSGWTIFLILIPIIGAIVLLYRLTRVSYGGNNAYGGCESPINQVNDIKGDGKGVIIGANTVLLKVVLEAYANIFDYSGRCSRDRFVTIIASNYTEWLFLILAMCAIIQSTATGWVRRLHDINRSGMWMLLASIPILGWLLLLLFSIAPGTRGPNAYGPDPKAAPEV